MKRILSLFLCATMVISLLFALPVAAVNDSKLYSLYDFEDGTLDLYGNPGGFPTLEIAFGLGAFGSKNAMRITSNGITYDLEALSEKHAFTAYAGDVFHASMYVKLVTPQAENSAGKFAFQLQSGQNFNNGAKSRFVEATFDKNNTDWQKIEFAYTFEKDFVDDSTTTGVNEAISNVKLRLCVERDSNKASDGTSNCTYLIDDIEMYVERKAEAGSFRGVQTGMEATDAVQVEAGTNYAREVSTTEAHSGNQSVLVTAANVHNVYSWGSGIKNDGQPLNLAVKTGDTISASVYVKLAQPFSVDSPGSFSFLTYVSGTTDLSYKALSCNIADVTDATNWQKLQLSYTWPYSDATLTSWELRLANENRLPGATADAPGARSYYLDDLTIEITDSTTQPGTPVITNAREKGSFNVGGQVGVAYDFDVTGGGTDASVIKLMSGDGENGVCLAKTSPNQMITVTEDMLGKSYYWEIVPISSRGYVGQKVIVKSTKPAFADFKLYSFEDGDNLDIAGATVTDDGYLGTKGLSFAADNVAVPTTIDPGCDYQVSAKVHATSAPTANFTLGSVDTPMNVTALGDNWYALSIAEYNYNDTETTGSMAQQLSANAKITLGASTDYVLDDVVLKPASMTEASGISVALPQTAAVFEAVTATMTDAAQSQGKNYYYVFEISEDGTNWAMVDSGLTTDLSILYQTDATLADKKLRATIYTGGTSYSYKTSNVLEENTTKIVSKGIKVTDTQGKEVDTVSGTTLTAAATVYNPFDAPQSVTLYNAVYSATTKELAYIRSQTVSVGKGIHDLSKAIDMTDVSHYSDYTHYLKSFLWNEMTPLAEAKTVREKALDGAVFNMYIDPSIETVEGMIMMNQHGECGSYALSENFRAFCKERNLAIFDFYDGANGDLKWFNNPETIPMLEAKIAEFAHSTGHPELNYVPFATIGHSNGVAAAGRLANKIPERAFAVVAYKSGWGEYFEYNNLKDYKIPVFAITGEDDVAWGYHDQIHVAERMVAQGAPVTYVQHPNGGHGGMAETEDIMLAFLDEAYKAKVKNAAVSGSGVTMNQVDIENGYIGYGDYTETPQSDVNVYSYENPRYMTYAAYKETLKTDSGFLAQAWLFNEDFAQKWVNFNNTGSITD